jgi:hypothetical protein
LYDFNTFLALDTLLLKYGLLAKLGLAVFHPFFREQSWGFAMATRGRNERLQIMLTEAELSALDDWRFARRMPSRASAIRELLKRGLIAEGFGSANKLTKSKDFGLLQEGSTKTTAKRTAT